MERALDWLLEERHEEPKGDLDSIGVATRSAAATEFAFVAALLPTGDISVRLRDNRTLSAKRATSCLVDPRLGDRIFVAIDGSEAFVLAVLESSEKATVISTSGDLTLRAHGTVSVVGDEKVEIASAGEVSVSSPALSIRTLTGKLCSESLAVIGRTLEAEIDRVRTVAQSVDSVMERLTEHVKRSHRTVLELDSVRAGQIDYVATGNAAIHADNTLLTAEKLVKINGEQVHIG